MDDLFKKIYENVIYYEDDTIKAREQLDTEVNNLLKPYSKQFNEEEIEIIKALMYQIALYSEKTGFWLGMKYTTKACMKLLDK